LSDVIGEFVMISAWL